MTQVSRFPLPKFLEEQMYKAIRKAFSHLRSEEDVAAFLEDLFSPTERIMIAKRLAIAILLDRGYEQRTVGSIMKTSLTTVNQVNYWLKNKGKGYRHDNRVAFILFRVIITGTMSNLIYSCCRATASRLGVRVVRIT